ncbi:MAG: helix-turn-helix domain-containing protein [Planctomycetes bacterium]|nr:helix-turn-helix domain-containing protein [Planctomycetota bacterium]
MKRTRGSRAAAPAVRLDRMMSARIGGDAANRRVAQLLREVREHVGLTQRQLAKLVGTTQPAIARLENAKYRGHSFGVLQRIATALGCDLDVRLVDRQ